MGNGYESHDIQKKRTWILRQIQRHRTILGIDARFFIEIVCFQFGWLECVEIYRLVSFVPTVNVTGNRVDIMAHGLS